MMPSRGLHALRGKLPRIQHQAATRNLSSTTRPSLRFASPTSSAISHPTTRLARSTRRAIPSIVAFRYASTQQSATPVADATTAATSSSSSSSSFSSFSNIDTITLDQVSKNAILAPDAIPEQIGYLHAIGVDYGYGPTSIIQWVLEHAHVALNLPWWGAIVLTAASLRLILFPLYLKMSDSQARASALAPVLKPFNDKMVSEMRNNNTAAAMQAQQQIAAIKKRAGISTAGMFAPMIAQGVLGYCGFRLMRHLATLPVPGLTNGGFLWVTDLTMTDGYLLLPLIMAGTMHVVVRLGGESGAASAVAPGLRKVMLYGMPLLILLFTSWQPGAVALWFVGSGLIGIPQALLLQRPAVREYFGLAPTYKAKPTETTGFLQAFMDANNPTAAASPASTPRAPHAGGKNAAYMRPQYQSPNVRTAPSSGAGRTIDAQLVDKSDMVQPSAPAKGIFEQAKEKFQAGRDAVNKLSERTAEQTKASQRAEYKRQAQEYEKRRTGKK
ncbi:Putative membrane insertase YidC/ALB3/OXA1/COX18 [Septoria linicola]|uniref:Membrane insertase YidC/ALB3/OXA1/COX18 n=1 Tax=Septoria linicola TaxID=215465 RepID=A0A9Q9EIK3_9PEZI|nr:putative membrane insertase YidC/ALB3/OXA1/COX18 [Septoria linicola]USW51137.1 Putative membrane insertase YidC/ALB3/OXA1/COX18 [Septoria linicola]